MDKAAETEREIREQLAGGNALSANDLAASALGAGSTAIRYLYLLSLASAGATQRALNRYEELAPPQGERSEDWLALPARLHKDLAFAGIEPEVHLVKAAALYDEAHDRTGGTFSGINAATLHYLAGGPVAGRELATRVLADLERETPVGDRAKYYWHATRAEALLLLERTEEARAELAKADPLIRDDLTARSRTRTQLARILDRQHPRAKVELQIALPSIYLFDPATVEGAPPPLAAPLADRVAGSPVFMPVPLTPEGLAGARALQRAGARIHLTLPLTAARVRARVETTHGFEAAALFDELLAQAERTSTLTGFLDDEAPWREVQARRLAQGLARATAISLGSEVRAIRAEGAAWQVGPEPEPPEAMAAGARRMVGLVFCDAAGFSTFSDADLQRYWSVAVPRFAEVFARAGAEVLLQQTWGDALHVVTAHPQAAARIALDLLAAVRQIRGEEGGKLAALDMRIGAHFAPAFRGRDPIQDATTYYGTQLSFTARVEPVTPPGTVYVTEPFAAELELQAPGEFRTEYAGELPLAKRYGTFRLASLKPGAKPAGAVSRALSIGVTGHLVLDAGARARVETAVASYLKQRLLRGGQVRLLTGLAPGADLVLSNAVRDAVAAAGGTLAVNALLVSEPGQIIAHWLRRAGEQLGRNPSETSQANVQQSMHEWLDLADKRESLYEPAATEGAFQKLAARLALQPDLLIAVLRPGHAGQAGGTAEVVAWRRDPQQVPAEFAGALRPNARRELLLVDPDTGATQTEGLA